ncbi:hypothetical protein KIN20_024399 [Parelaphostrongylus tenuis]|uniref:Uncharacterized protein n=1 Tax=Parelaphostrongylus tenuis TaxID=148309 RepID=A0AAD5NB42_PARTN|nr:hypothetical protein KIN20_024399 [Parelaphostrongylus tenuis]
MDIYLNPGGFQWMGETKEGETLRMEIETKCRQPAHFSLTFENIFAGLTMSNQKTNAIHGSFVILGTFD